MNLKQAVGYFKQLPPVTQVSLIALTLVVIVLLIIYPTTGTSIITFLVALKVVLNQPKENDS